MNDPDNMYGNEQFDTAYFAAERVQSGLSDITDATVANAYATLALAYEQRTANLIAAFQAIENVDGDPTYLAVHEYDGKNLAHEIRARLGLETP